LSVADDVATQVRVQKPMNARNVAPLRMDTQSPRPGGCTVVYLGVSQQRFRRTRLQQRVKTRRPHQWSPPIVARASSAKRS
jgi:hypothetical protein